MKKHNKTTKGLIWKMGENVATQGMQFVIQMLLARMLLPEAFGIIGILNVFTNLANTLVNNGLSSALLRKKEYDPKAYSTVFLVSFVISLVGYAGIFAASPMIARFYEIPDLTPYLRVYTLTILVSSVTSNCNTMLRARMDFRGIFLGNFLGVLGQGICGIIMAMNGFGVWSLVFAHVVRYLIPAVVLMIFSRWRPYLYFSFAILKELFSYSWKLAVGWLIGTVYNDIFSLIIGKQFSAETLGYYTKGHSIPAMVNRVLTQTITSVMFPSLAKDQNDLDVIKKRTRTMISVSTGLVMPVMAGIAACAPALVSVLLTDRWLLAVPVIQIACIPKAINVVNSANMQSINAIGRSDVFLYSETIKRTITVILVLITSRIDFYLMLWSIAFMGLISMTVNMIANKKLMNYSFKEYAVDLLPYVAVSLLLFGGVYLLNLLQINIYAKLGLQLLACATIYFVAIFCLPLAGYQKARMIGLSILRGGKKA